MSLLVNNNGYIHESPLTHREREVLKLSAEGLQQKQIAAALMLSPGTIKKHLCNAYKKLNAHNRVQALTKAGFL